MSKNNSTDPRKSFVPLFLPWLLGAVMFVVYWLTLNPWITLANMGPIAQVTGYIWQPQLYSPLLYLVTLPFHWLPAAKIPLALNIFSAACAALVLVLLARCVVLLPQDRTEPQRQREKSDFNFLTGWQAYFPPIMAVVIFGLQMTFWKHATSFTGEMFDLLLFASIAWLLLEYRLDEKEWRLSTAVLAYGVGITEDTAFIGFFPVFLAAIIWTKKLEFFNLRLLTRLVFFGLAGMSLFLLLPFVAKWTHEYKIGFWESLKPAIRAVWVTLKSIKEGDVRVNLALASLSTLLPVLLMGIKWSSSYGDSSRIGSALASTMIHFVHAAVFTVCIWIMFDPQFAPQQLLSRPGMSVPSLPLNFFAALSIGYCCGYCLLVFSRKPAPTRRDPNPVPIFPPPLMWLCPLIIGLTFAAAAITVATLIYKNRPAIAQINSTTLLQFAKLTTENLPKADAILFCDSDRPGEDQPLRAILIQAEIDRENRTRNYPVIDTVALNWPAYHLHLHKKYPDKFPLIVKGNETNSVPPLKLLNLLESLSKSNVLCYLHPSYGYYFETFYQEPHGLVYPLKKIPEESIIPPPIGKDLIAENEKFWDRAVAELQTPVQKALAKPEPGKPKNLFEWLLLHLHPAPENNLNGVLTGMFCSRSLNDWGVQLQRGGELDRATKRFQDAKQFSPDNVAADRNLAFKESLRTGSPLDPNPDRVNADQFGKYRNWNELLTANGSIDEINFSSAAAFMFVQNGFFRQAAVYFSRVRQLAPDDLPTRLQLAQIYLFNKLPDRAMEALHDPIAQPDKFGLNGTNSISLSVLTAAVHFQKNETDDGCRLLETEISRHPEDDMLLTASTTVYFQRGLFTNALRVIDRKLTRSPNDVTWLYGKGYASIQLGDYDSSIKAMTRVLQLQTNNESARFNRALAYFKSDQLDRARADYTVLQSAYTNAYTIAYGLGEIARKKNDKNEALRNFQIYLANAPTNTAEYTAVADRVKTLK
jgi:tetratricopeptide (TPR) repeat protein